MNPIKKFLESFFAKQRVIGDDPTLKGLVKADAILNNFYKLAGGGYLSTSVDIAKLGQAYLDGAIFPEHIRSQFLNSQNLIGKPTYYGLG